MGARAQHLRSVRQRDIANGGLAHDEIARQ
jgi:hypothetical protein